MVDEPTRQERHVVHGHDHDRDLLAAASTSFSRPRQGYRRGVGIDAGRAASRVRARQPLPNTCRRRGHRRARAPEVPEERVGARDVLTLDEALFIEDDVGLPDSRLQGPRARDRGEGLDECAGRLVERPLRHIVL